MLQISNFPHPPAHQQARFLLLYRNSVLVETADNFLFSLAQFQPDHSAQPIYCGQWQQQDVFVCLLSRIPAGLQEIGLRDLLFQQDEAGYTLLSRARQLATWDKDHQFCGRCGTAMTQRHNSEHTKICPSCQLRHYPRISPCIIVSIRKEGNILLARGPMSPPGRFSNIAGFVEAGESLEEAVAREVREEIGIDIQNIEYVSSQPWSFPHQLMLGFFAEYAGGDLQPAPGEIEQADWYAPDNLPEIPPLATISGQLIRLHIQRLQDAPTNL
jgi:NAD+ diphosphatase